MAGFEAALLWLADVIAKKKLADLLQSGGATRQRMLEKALVAAQNELDELRNDRALLARVIAQRDTLHAEVLALRRAVAAPAALPKRRPRTAVRVEKPAR